MQLRGVTFYYKDSAEKGPHHRQYGLIAEEVAKVYPDLVQYDKQGKPFTVYYHLLIPMLLNELQREHRHFQAQDRKLAQQQTEMAAMKAAHQAEVAALKTELMAQHSEIVSLQQAQQQQIKALARLSASLQPAQTPEGAQKAVFIHRQ